jgi:uncharacterized protein YjbJ (UPF0337 family)
MMEARGKVGEALGKVREAVGYVGEDMEEGR